MKRIFRIYLTGLTVLFSALDQNFSKLGDNLILVCVLIIPISVYYVTYSRIVIGITGIRPEALENNSLPDGEPGTTKNGLKRPNFRIDSQKMTGTARPVADRSTLGHWF
jgi:hypothetical protein